MCTVFWPVIYDIVRGLLTLELRIPHSGQSVLSYQEHTV